jgi:hypothetical protein
MGVAFSFVTAFPLTRLFEFVLGMCAALLWRPPWGLVYGSALEIAALSLVVLASHLAMLIPNPVGAVRVVRDQCDPLRSCCTPDRFNGDELRAD